MTNYVFNWFALPLAFTALCSLAVGISILRREWRSRVGAALFLVTTTISVWFGASALAYCSTNAGTAVFWTRIEYMAVPVLPAAIYLYIAVGLRIYHRQKFLIWALFVIAAAFTGLVHSTGLLVSGVMRHWWGYYPIYGLAGPFFVAYFVLLIALGTLQLRGRLREIPRGSPFHERITLSLAAFAVISVGAIDFVAKFGVPLYPMGYLAILGFLAVILVLERRHRVVYMTPAVAAGQILATMQGAVLVTTREGRIEMGNRAAGQLLGYSDAGLLELSLEQVFGLGTEWRSLLANCLAGHAVRDRETLWRQKNGAEMSISVSASVLTDHRGEPLGAVFVGLDITARKVAEEALRLTQVSVDRAADLIHWVSPDGRLLYVSDSSCQRYGYSRAELLGMSVFDLDPTQSPEAWLLHWNELKAQGSLSFQTMHRTKDGEIFPVELTVNYVQSGGQEYNFSFARDITERRLWEERLAAERNHLSLLNEAAVEMSHCLTTTEVQSVGIRLARKATRCDGGVIWLLPTVSRRRVAWSDDLTRHGRRQLARMLRTSPAVERVLNERKSALLGQADLPSAESAGGDAFTGAMLVPITSRGKSLGLLCLATKPGHPSLTSQDSALAAGIAALVGVALENARLYDDARYLAERDPVTSLLNHRGINSELEKELCRNERSGGCFSVVMMDLDNFKLFNDTYGHVVGDQVLQKVSSILGAAVRRADLVGRYGGDEFVAVLPDTDAIGAMRTVERIRKTMRESGFKADGGSPMPVFMSYGVATYPFDGRHVGELLSVADANLYRSKRQGGDCVTIPDEDEEKTGAEGGIYSVLDRLVTTVDHKDHYTRKHSDDVCERAVALAAELGLSVESQRCVRIAALLHDVGKIGIPDHILRKPGSLTPEEYEAIKQHVSLGELIINEIPNLTEVLGAVGSNHEHFDGNGYPRGLKGEAIPLLGRILAVTDAYSAMTTDRPYRRAMTIDEAREELLRVCGTQLDPRVVLAFLGILDREASEPDQEGAEAIFTAA